jgi:hypothetical protein
MKDTMDRSEKTTRYEESLEQLEYLLGVEGKCALDVDNIDLADLNEVDQRYLELLLQTHF